MRIVFCVTVDQANVLSDRIGIIKNGTLITCGSSLFLKHRFGDGYTLNQESSSQSVDVTTVVREAEPLSTENVGNGCYQWRLEHGSESAFPSILDALSEAGTTNVSLELTTLEQVFLETGKVDYNDGEEEETHANE